MRSSAMPSRSHQTESVVIPKSAQPLAKGIPLSVLIDLYSPYSRKNRSKTVKAYCALEPRGHSLIVILSSSARRQGLTVWRQLWRQDRLVLGIPRERLLDCVKGVHERPVDGTNEEVIARVRSRGPVIDVFPSPAVSAALHTTEISPNVIMLECVKLLDHWDVSTAASTCRVAPEQALIARFGTVGRVPTLFLLKSDEGLVFTSRAYTRLVRSYGLKQEFITPHCPQQN